MFVVLAYALAFLIAGTFAQRTEDTRGQFVVSTVTQSNDEDRERKLLEYVLENAERNNVTSVINAMDDFASKNWMMNLGQEKAEIVEERIRKCEPEMMVELGTYCGYSAVRFADLQRQLDTTGTAKYYTYEISEKNADIAKQIISFAGLSNRVKVNVGAFDKIFPDSGQPKLICSSLITLKNVICLISS